MQVKIRAMSMHDYAEVRALWERSPGVGLNESDSREAIIAFLERNPELSAVAVAGERIVGAVLCGHDGRRGYLHHLAVEASDRDQGIARELLGRCLRGLAERGIPKCNVLLFSDNELGAAFWQHNGWISRSDLRVFQRPISSTVGASPAA